MLRRSPRRFLRIHAFIHPPRALQSVFVSAPLHELPDSPRPRARKRQRLTRAISLRQVNQVLRHALFPQHPRDHVVVFSLPPQSRLHDRPPARRLEEIKVGNHHVVHRQRQVVRKALCSFFRPLLQFRVHWKGHLRHFVKVPPRGRQVPGLVVGLSRGKLRLHYFNQVGNPARHPRCQRNQRLRLQVPQRQVPDGARSRLQHPCLHWLCLRHLCHVCLLCLLRFQRRGVRLHRPLRRI